MKARTTTILTLCLSLLIPLALASADDDSGEKPAKEQKVASARKAAMPVFVPSNLGAPATRLGGATRSATDDIPRTEALVPEVAGHTLSAQPVIYWYLAAPTDLRVDFTVINVESGEQLVQATLSPIEGAGIKRVRIADHGVSLEPGIDYQWFVALVPNPEQRLYDRIIGGGIERVATSDELKAKLDGASDADAHFALAEAGIWYDALDSVSRQIEADPADDHLVAERAALFDQVGLGSVN